MIHVLFLFQSHNEILSPQCFRKVSVLISLDDLLNTTDSKNPFVKKKKKKIIIFKIVWKTLGLLEKQFGLKPRYGTAKKCSHVHGCFESARARAGTLPHGEMKHSHNEGFGFIHMLPWFIQMLLCHVSKEIERHATTLRKWPCFHIRGVGLRRFL